MADPVSTALRRLGQEAADQQRAINLARTAMRDAVHFGRPQAVIDDLARRLEMLEGPAPTPVVVPPPVLDPVSVEYAAIGGPRSWAEQRVMNAGAEAALGAADGPSSDALDAVRSNSLMRSRIDRLSPEQRAQSIAAVAFQAADDARAAKLAQIAAGERRKAQAKAVANALGQAGLAAGIGGMTGVSLGVVGSNISDRRQQEQNVITDYRKRVAERNAVSQAMNAALGEMVDDITLSGTSPMDGLEDYISGDIRGVPSPEPDIFTEEPQIMLEEESQRDAIRRIMAQRYGR